MEGDRRWLALAVGELIDNAVKFSPEGGRIVVGLRPGSETVELSVSDHGTGMTAEDYQAMFGEFVQVDGSDTRRFGGLGLGLAVVRRVVTAHRGIVRCHTSPDHGSTFIIDLPARAGGRALLTSPTEPGTGS